LYQTGDVSIFSCNCHLSHLFQELENHPDPQVTLCYHFDTTIINFAYTETEYQAAPDHVCSEEKDMKEGQFEKIAKICR